jgi:hypothetical protein
LILSLLQSFGFRCQVSAQPPAKKTAGQIEKETNSSPQSSQRTLRKKILNNLCARRVLCGEILLENGIGFHEVSYKVSDQGHRASVFKGKCAMLSAP